jgi:hypothetical protein
MNRISIIYVVLCLMVAVYVHAQEEPFVLGLTCGFLLPADGGIPNDSLKLDAMLFLVEMISIDAALGVYAPFSAAGFTLSVFFHAARHSPIDVYGGAGFSAIATVPAVDFPFTVGIDVRLGDNLLFRMQERIRMLTLAFPCFDTTLGLAFEI